MIASGSASIASPQASAPPFASRTCHRNPVSTSLSRCRKLPSALATNAVRARMRERAGDINAAVDAISNPPG